MGTSRYLVFGPYRLDRLEGRLWRNTTAVHLSGKAHRLLTHLAQHAGKLVSKEDLLGAVWPHSVVVEGVLTTTIKEVRRALEDPSHESTYIQTVHRRGYRFIAPVTCCDTLPAASHQNADVSLVGREAQWTQLCERFATAFAGTRQLVFVAGEAGIGKTALVDAFAAHLAAQTGVTLMHGQCIEHYGTGEAYLPILEALGRRGRGGDAPLAELLRRCAPSWLPHLPALLSAQERSAISSSSPVTAARMLRELTDALDELATNRPVVLILEDLHWSDTATLDWLAYVARRRDPARLMVLATYRPVDVIVRTHPLRALVGELQRHAQAAQIVLDYLSRQAVAEYVGRRLAGLTEAAELAQLLYQRTSGHPLFLVTILETLLRERLLEQDGTAWRLRGPLTIVSDVLPSSIRQLIEQRIEQLSDEDQRVLEAASIAGDTFASATLACATQLHEEHIEARCAHWARQQQILVAAGSEVWPDGTTSSRFRFRHALFHDTVYRRIPPGRRVRLHFAVGRTLAEAYAPDTASIAAELARHFEQGGDGVAAVTYLEQAAARAIQRSAYTEALGHIKTALALTEHCEESMQRARRQLRLHLALGTALMATRGWAAPEVEQVHLRAKALCEQLGDSTRLIMALWGLIAVSVVRAELHRTRSLSEHLLALTREENQVPFQCAGHMELAGAAFGLGELALAHEEFAIADRLYDPTQHREHITRTSFDQGVFLRSWWSHLLWQLGDAGRAIAMSDSSLQLARSFDHPFTYAIALSYAAILRQFLGNTSEASDLADEAVALCTEQGFAYYRTWAQIVRGWCLTQRGCIQEGAASMRDGIIALQSAGVRRALPYFNALLAEAHLRCSDTDEAERVIDAGLAVVRATGECWWESELWRLKSGIARDKQHDHDARRYLQSALDLAGRCRSEALKERALADLSVLSSMRR